MQDALSRLATYWSELGCLTVQPTNTEVGAGTMNPATLLRVLGPEPWRVAYVEPSVRPDDSRYGENPNRIQTHTQFQVILKPEPGDAQELYLGSLAAIGIDLDAHDVRFVEDNWASPALGAWGLGWEVWLDGLEITQFTYFQQAGGINLDPVSVEITYGVERILMALQNVTHFKDIAYAEGVSYGEVFGQAEYEMSRYYLDDADVAANRSLFALYAGEAQRMIDARLPVPAYSYVLKCSHAFNVLDARGVVSTSDRAAEFARMRRLTADVARLWVARREESGFPLGTVIPPVPDARPREDPQDVGAPAGAARLVVFEVGTEEMPPSEAHSAAGQLTAAVTAQLQATRLPHGQVTVRATPRRLVASIENVQAAEPDHVRTVKGPRTSAAFDADGRPTKAALGFARSQGLDVTRLDRDTVGGHEHLVARVAETGRTSVAVLAEALSAAVGSLRSAKNMRWRDPGLAFTRPIRWMLALHGEQLVPVIASTLTAGRTTRLHRDTAGSSHPVASAEDYAAVLRAGGIVLDADQRRAAILAAAQQLAASVGGSVDIDAEAALLDQITYLIEEPTALLGAFAESYLELPEAVLVAVMRRHQRYLPVRDPLGRLLPHFVVIANGRIDHDLVRAGNEAVLRARYEDAAFFYRSDLDLPLPAMRTALDRLTFTDRLGSMRDRADRIAALAGALAEGITLDAGQRTTLDRARQLTKVDLGSAIVTEMTSLAGVMAREYARHAGEPDDVALALYECELPRHTGDDLPRSLPGAVLALADRLDLLVGLAATTGLPTGSSDPFALRRAVLGTVAIYRAHPQLNRHGLTHALHVAAANQPVEVRPEVLTDIVEFAARRLEQQLTDEGRPVDLVRAVARHADRPHRVDVLLRQLGGLIDSPGFRILAEALDRARRIAGDATGDYDPALLTEPAEVALHEAVKRVRADLDGTADLDAFTRVAAPIADPVNTFFDEVYVMADDPAVRRTRLSLLAAVRDLGAGILGWEHLHW
jgi:glycyl-tRNA synthetase